MAYIGTPPASRVLSSDDIAQGAVTLNDINFTDQPTNMDITGTIDKHTMRLADGVTITGDVTISDDLVLSKISDDGNAITMTNDGSTRTITGSGSIEASTLAATPQYQSLTGMTGDIGSAVTGGSGLSVTGMTGELGSGITNNAGVASGTIGSSVTGQNRPYFFCSEYSANSTIGSATELTVWTEGINGDPDSKFNTTTGRFTPGVAGIYLFGARIMFEGTGSSWQRVYIRVNNGSNSDVYYESNSSTGMSTDLTRMEYLSDTGYASVLAQTHSNTAALRGSVCHFWGIRIA